MSSTKTLSRRTFLGRSFLGGAGVMMSLPLLEAMLPARAGAAAAGTAQRLVALYVPNGIHMPAWTPAQTGPGFALPSLLEPLQAFQSELMVISGLANTPGQPDGFGDHAAGTGAFLTCTHVNKSETTITNGTSMDQLYAQHIGGETVIPSLQLGGEGGGNAGNCDSGYACAYVRNISWVGNTPLSKITSPATVFDLLFSGFDPGASAQDLALRKANRLSVLDRTMEDADRLGMQLGATDRIKLEEYLDSVRELELKVEAEEQMGTCDPGGNPGEPEDFRVRIQLLLELIVKAFECDRTRTISFMLGNGASLRTYGFLGYPNGHHLYSHHGDSQANFAAIQAINRWEVEQLAYLLERLSSVVQPTGSTLLDDTMVYFSSEVEDGNAHRHTNLPVLLAGRGGGVIETGRHVRHDGVPLANLYLSMLKGLGVPIDSFANSTGTIPLG